MSIAAPNRAQTYEYRMQYAAKLRRKHPTWSWAQLHAAIGGPYRTDHIFSLRFTAWLRRNEAEAMSLHGEDVPTKTELQARGWRTVQAAAAVLGVSMAIVSRPERRGERVWMARVVAAGVLRDGLRSEASLEELSLALGSEPTIVRQRLDEWKKWPIELRSVFRVLVDEAIQRRQSQTAA